jgi:hypothetical protein
MLVSLGDAAAPSSGPSTGAGPRSLSPPNISRSVRTCTACHAGHKGGDKDREMGKKAAACQGNNAQAGGAKREGRNAQS